MKIKVFQHKKNRKHCIRKRRLKNLLPDSLALTQFSPIQPPASLSLRIKCHWTYRVQAPRLLLSPHYGTTLQAVYHSQRNHPLIIAPHQLLHINCELAARIAFRPRKTPILLSILSSLEPRKNISLRYPPATERPDYTT